MIESKEFDRKIDAALQRIETCNKNIAGTTDEEMLAFYKCQLKFDMDQINKMRSMRSLN